MTEEEDEPLTIGDWTAYQDDEGRTYYYNSVTEESSWDVPPGFEEHDGGGHDLGGSDEAARDEDEGFGASPPYVRTPPIHDDDNNSGDDRITASPGLKSPGNYDFDYGKNDGITKSPGDPEEEDGYTKSPSGMDNKIGDNDDEVFTRSPTNDANQKYDDGITRSPRDDIHYPNGANEGDGEGTPEGNDIGGGWIAYQDDEGRTYYYNIDSGETQWDRPDIPSVTGRESPRGREEGFEGPLTPSSTLPADENSAVTKNESSPKPIDANHKLTIKTIKGPQKGESKPEKPKEDPATTAEKFLRQPDAVMEPSVLDHITVLVDALGPQVAGPKAMQSLINGYVGDTAMCGLMGLWLMQLKGSGVGSEGVDGGKGGGLIGSARGVSTIGGGNNGKSKMAQVVKKVITNQSGKSEEEERLEQGANAARDVVEEVMNRLVKERFTKDGGDAIMSLSKKQAAFVDEMIHSERWRKLLVSRCYFDGRICKM